jgi:hypothetical protein
MMNTTRRYNSHKSCTHASTKQARAICRKTSTSTTTIPTQLHYVTMRSGVIHMTFIDADLIERTACTRQVPSARNVDESFTLSPTSNAAIEHSKFCKNCKKIASDDLKRQSFETSILV